MVQAAAVAVPEVDQRVVEGVLATCLPHARGRRLVLLHGRYRADAPREFAVRVAEQQWRVTVCHQSSVLGIVDAWQAHLASGAEGLLVVTTDAPPALLGPDLLGEAVGREPLTVDRLDIVKQRFGAVDADPRIRQADWLAEALLAAEPVDGWPAAGAVLTLDAAMRALVWARLGLGERPSAGSGPLDADTLLAWSWSPGKPTRFTDTDPVERAGMADWLSRVVGEVAPLLLALAQAGQGRDAMALGVIASVLADPSATPDAALAVGQLFGSVRFKPEELRSYTRAVEGVLTRWTGQALAGRDPDARQRVLEVLDRADQLAASAGLTRALARNPFLPSGFRTRLRALAATLTARPTPKSLAASVTALGDLKDHQLAELAGREELAVAELAVRLQHWLAAPEPVLPSGQGAGAGVVAAAVHQHLADWGWADRALNRLWDGDTGGDPQVGQAYRTLHDSARARRERLDRAFAAALAPWARQASSADPEGALLIEDVLKKVAVPLANKSPRPPMILLLDGMSSAIAIQLGEQLAAARWTEVTPNTAARAGLRATAVSAIPSVTRVSRASLLSGRPVTGGQNAEQEGFTAFWRRHNREAQLFQKNELQGPAGNRIAQPLLAALAGQNVVGVVLNTIDDALDHGREGSIADWQLSDIRFLRELLDAARGQGRPILLAADHGHVLERGGPDDAPVRAEGVESARWRTGSRAEDGEVELSGPRVLEGRRRIVAAWREDLRYTPRKAGYHGGAALAEMAVPLLVLLPSTDPEPLPPGWSLIAPEAVAPVWWRQLAEAPIPPPPSTAEQPPAAAPRKRAPAKKGHSASPQPTPFEVGAKSADVPVPVRVPGTLGERVVNSDVYGAQKQFVRKPPERRAVAAVIDALVEAGNTLSLAAVAQAAAASGGRAPRNIEFFVAVLQRLLNVEGYAVLSLIDTGTRVRIQPALLSEQFGV